MLEELVSKKGRKESKMLAVQRLTQLQYLYNMGNYSVTHNTNTLTHTFKHITSFPFSFITSDETVNKIDF